MNQITMINETTPVNIEHHTYKRECRYTRGIHIPLKDMENILNSMNEDTLTTDFHITNLEFMSSFCTIDSKIVSNLLNKTKSKDLPVPK